MANEISANNIKQSYDLAENKIFPKTTINGIVFDSDDSVVGSSAIVKSLVNENLLVKNIEVNTDSSTGGYIHLKTNNGDASGVSVLELKLGHKGVDDTSTNKIYINEANDPNTDVSAFFNNVGIVSNSVNATYDKLQVQCNKFAAKYDDGSVVIAKGGVSANVFSVIKDGIEHGVLSSWNDGICLNGGDNGIMLNGVYGVALGKKSSYGQFVTDGSALILDCRGNSSKPNNIDVSIFTHGKLGATYENGIGLTTKGEINLNSNKVIISGDGSVSELHIVQNLDTEQGGDIVKVYSDSSDSTQFNFGLGVNINSYHFKYDDIVKYRMQESGIANLTLRVYDYDSNSSVSGDGYITIGSDEISLKTKDISLDCQRVYGTVNDVHNVLMGVPIGSVVKWIVDSSIPEGWTKKDSIGTYVGIVLVDKGKEPYTYTLCTASVQAIEYRTDSGASIVYGTYAYCYYTDSSTVVGLTESEFNEYIKIPSGYIISSNDHETIGGVEITEQNRRNYEFYHVFSFNETTKRLSGMFKYYDASNFSPIIYTDASNGFLCKFGRTNVNDESLSLRWYYRLLDKPILTLFMSDYIKDSMGNIKIHYARDINAIKRANVIFSDYIDINWDNYEIMKCQ